MAPLPVGGAASISCRRTSSPRWRSRRGRTSRWWRRWPLRRHEHLQDSQRAEDYPTRNSGPVFLAWKSGLKGWPPTARTRCWARCSRSRRSRSPQDFVEDDRNRRIRIKSVPQPVLASLRWPGRPDLGSGNPAWTYMITHPHYHFAVFVGHVENGKPHAFESGSTAASSRAASARWRRRCRWTCAPRIRAGSSSSWRRSPRPRG